MGYLGRDVEVVSLEKNKHIVVACDSCGAIGSKELDKVKISPYIVGRFTTRVALYEILATEAKPIMVTVTSSCEPYPTTEEMLVGVKDELKSFNLPDLAMTISTEKNISTSQTGLGITVIGVCKKEAVRIATSMPGDDIYCLGIPKVGSEVVVHDDPDIVQGEQLLTLLVYREIHDIIPVGSRGIRQEAESLALEVGGNFQPEESVRINLDKSGGPSTCLIFTCEHGYLPPVFTTTPLLKIGKI